MKKLFVLALVLGFVTVAAMPAVAVKAPPILKFDGPKKAPVTFDHAAHESRAGDCVSCHHMGVGTGSCTDCHGGSAEAPTRKRAFHQNCRTCHADKYKARDCGYCHGN